MHECTIRIPDICVGYSVDGLEPAHGNWSYFGKGMSLKADDVFAAACHACHTEVDQGKNLSREEREYYWMRGAIRTWAELMRTQRLQIV